jgi:RHS repeat-associated protein
MAVEEYVHDGDNVLEVTDGSGVTIRTYTHKPGRSGDLLSEFDGSSTRYYEPDGLGSTDALTDETQTVIDRWKYQSFGSATQTAGTDITPYLFVGRQGYQQEVESALYLLRARFYDPATCRFLSRDPIGFAGGDSNLYAYVRNNPVNRIDPTGRQSRCTRNNEGLGPPSPCDENVKEAFRIFKRCEEAEKKLDECLGKYGESIKVECDASIGSNDAEWAQEVGKILINPNGQSHKDRSPSFIPALILFEVLNACSNEAFRRIVARCMNGELSETEFVRAIERVEISNFSEHRRIALACSTGSEAIWDAKTDVFAVYAGFDFEDYYKSAKASGHTEQYETYWGKRCALPYFRRILRPDRVKT